MLGSWDARIMDLEKEIKEAVRRLEQLIIEQTIGLVYDGVDSTSVVQALSANMGRALNEKVLALGPVDNLTSDSDIAALSANMGRFL